MSALKAKFALSFAVSAFYFVSVASPLFGQIGGGGNVGGGLIQRVVGGVRIDANGVVANVESTLNPESQRAIENANRQVQSEGEIADATPLRMISLRRLEEALTNAKANNQTLPAEYLYMAGLQRIEFVVISHEKNDIFLGGPAEGWQVNEQGIVVGNKSGTPVIHLEDFLAAMRSSDAARTGEGISVSIDPTEKGAQEVQRLFQTMSARRVSFNPQMKGEVERAMGDQLITLTGVPNDSRFAQVLVAADYKMKRYSMGFEKAPVKDLPSVMEMAATKGARLDNAAPRFWMECNYQPIGRSEEGSIWQIRGQGVKTLTEDSRFDQAGQRQTTGNKNQFAAKWAELMTEKFEQLAAAEPCFRELRNAMDLSVMAAIINRESLLEKADLKLQAILNSTNVQLPSWNVPKTVPAQCSYFKSSNSWLVSASGGVQLDPWGVVQQQEVVPQLSEVAVANISDDRWWWNAN